MDNLPDVLRASAGGACPTSFAELSARLRDAGSRTRYARTGMDTRHVSPRSLFSNLPRLLLAGLLLATPTALAQDEIPTEDVATPFSGLEERTVDELFDTANLAEHSLAEIAQMAEDDLERGRFVHARALAEEILRRDKASPEGHYLLGVVHHRGEANLPLALYHLKKSRRLLEREASPFPADESMIRWHFMTLFELDGLFDLSHRVLVHRAGAAELAEPVASRPEQLRAKTSTTQEPRRPR